MENFNCSVCKLCKHDYVYGTETEPDPVYLASCSLYHQDDWVEDRFKDVLNYNKFIATSTSLQGITIKLGRKPRWCELQNDNNEELFPLLIKRIEDINTQRIKDANIH